VARGLLALAVTTALAAPLAWAHTSPEQEIRVRIKRHLITVEITGMNLQVSPPSVFFEVEPNTGFRRAKITRKASGTWIVHWDHAKKAVKIASERLWVRGEMIRVGVESAPYDLELLKNAGKAGIDVIARLDLETYLQGVLPAEMPVTWPLEALKAQAVSARSFVLKQAMEHKRRDFDVEANVLDQMYKFIDESKQHPGWAEKLRQALSETRGQVLLDPMHHILKAYYSADCGCQSEDPKFVWGKTAGSFQSVKDPTCASRKPLKWSFSLARQEVRNKLIAALGLADETNLKALQVSGRTPSGRVAKVVAALETRGKVKNVAMNSQEFRKIFGFEKIQSTDFTMQWSSDQLEINGEGSGHGVGLCQRGARTLAENGQSYDNILKMYYPKAMLQR